MVVNGKMSGLRRWRGRLIAGGAATALVAAGIVVAASAQAATGCQVKYSTTAEWPGGFVADVSLTNLGEPVTHWSLEWNFTSGQKVDQGWGATLAASGSKVTATNAGYNGAIATNGTVSFGLIGAWSGSNAVPTSFAFNGVQCNGGVTPTTAPTSSSVPSSTPPSTMPPSTPPTSTPPSGDAMTAVAEMQPGWNLGNTLDATGSDETSWGNPKVTKELIHAVKAEGFKSIRIPVTWGQHQGPAPDYTIDAAYLKRVKEVVDMALADDLYVMLNVHHDSWQWINKLTTEHDTVLAQYKKLWTQISTEFRDEPAKLTLESVNEPQFANTTDVSQQVKLLDELNTTFRDIVRASGGNNASRLLVIPTLNTGSEQVKVDPLVSWINGTKDKNIIATVHFYGYWPFSTNIAGTTTFDAATQKDLTDSFDRVYDAFVAKGVPVIIGEYGLLGFDKTLGAIEQGEKLKFFEFLGYYARTKKITTMLWDNGQHLNRTTLKWGDTELIDQIKSSWKTRSGTASSDQVYVNKSAAIAGKSLTLNLNGTTFSGLSQNGKDLVKGTDYTVSGDQLTLSAAAVTRLVGSRAYGVNATLQAHFSTGVPWRIDVLSYEPPVLSNATGTTDGLTIATKFRGDQLSTMEAKYADGTGAGPNDWTPFKEFDGDFSPDYAGGALLLKKSFLGALRDGAKVNLTFHFNSGALVNYTVTKSGTAVTGSAS